jgi:hypothetical protein
MRLRAFLSFMTVISSPTAAFQRGLERAGIAHDSRGLSSTPLRQAQQFSQVVDDGFKRASLEPALGLVVGGVPGRELVRRYR